VEENTRNFFLCLKASTDPNARSRKWLYTMRSQAMRHFLARMVKFGTPLDQSAPPINLTHVLAMGEAYMKMGTVRAHSDFLSILTLWLVRNALPVPAGRCVSVVSLFLTGSRGAAQYRDEKVADRDIRVWHGATENGP
jgi:hypothetical protein